MTLAQVVISPSTLTPLQGWLLIAAAVLAAALAYVTYTLLAPTLKSPPSWRWPVTLTFTAIVVWVLVMTA